MAKRTNLELVNFVLENIGESAVTVLTSMTPTVQLCFDKICESIIELAGLADWMPLETMGTATMATGTNTFPIPTDLMKEDKDSFRLPDNGSKGSMMVFAEDPTVWDTTYPAGITTDMTGWATHIRRFGTNYELNRIPASGQNGKLVKYRYWQMPTLIGTGTSSNTTCWIPQQMDDLVLINLATYKVMTARGDEEAMIYFQRVFGRKDSDKGNLEIMKSLYVRIPSKIPVKWNY